MKLVGSSEQQVRHPLYCADGTIATGGTPQLILGISQSRSSLILQNLSVGNLVFEFGSARATATYSAGTVASVAVTNAGFNFTKAPLIRFLGGGGNDGVNGNSSYLGLNQPNGPSPSHPARAHAVMTGSAGNLSISSIVVDDGGANYLCAPYVFIMNSDLDPYGCAVPSATVGLLVAPATGPIAWNGTTCPTDAVAVYGATTSQAYLCRWTD